MNNQSSKNPTFFWKVFFVGLLITLVVGLLIGYGIWGKKSEKLNIKTLLSQVADYIEVLEDKSTSFQDQIKKMKGTVEKGEKAIQSMELMKKDLAEIKVENKELKKALGEKDALTEQVKRLKKENEELRSTMQKVKDVIKKPTPSLQTDNPSS